jgi:hypothetical protein
LPKRVTGGYGEFENRYNAEINGYFICDPRAASDLILSIHRRALKKRRLQGPARRSRLGEFDKKRGDRAGSRHYALLVRRNRDRFAARFPSKPISRCEPWSVPNVFFQGISSGQKAGR